MRNSLHRLLVLLLALAWALPLQAQDETFPTVQALETTEIPIRDRVVLAQEINQVESVEPTPTGPPNYLVGDIMNFHVANSSAGEVREVPAMLRVMGKHVLLWVENSARMTDEDLQALAEAFDERVYPNVRDLWGEENNPGIDGDPRIFILFAYNLGSGTAAYYSSDHTFPSDVVSFSNQHEMFFVNLDAVTTRPDLGLVESILAHEFQHMIRDRLQLNEDYWLNEGFSEFTQRHLYNQIPFEGVSFLQVPSTQLNTWPEDRNERGLHYGAAMMFVSYFYDRYGADALRALSEDPAPRGFTGFDDVLGQLDQPGLDEFFADWALANLMMNSELEDGRFGYESMPPAMPSAEPLLTISEGPFHYEGYLNQYGTDYFIVNLATDTPTFELEITAPDTVPLVPAEANSGAWMWYSNRANNSRMSLTHRFDLSGVSTAALDFSMWFHMEEDWDYGYIMASRDGQHWEPLETEHTTSTDPFGLSYGPAFTGFSADQGSASGWLEESVSLDAYTGGEMWVRFELITDDAITEPGMLIDDVRLDAVGYSEDFENGPGDWTSEGWVYTDNRLPQDAWVQVIQQVEDSVTVDRWRLSEQTQRTITLIPEAQFVAVAISPLARVTTVPMPYDLDLR